MLKAGKFICKVLAPINGWFGEAGENATPFIRLPLIVIPGEECEGEETEFHGWLTDKSLDRTVKNLADVFGWDGDLEALAKLVNSGPFVGRECQIVTEEETYKDKRRIVIKWLNRADGGGKTMAADAALTLARRLNERAKKAAASPSTPTPSPRPHPLTNPDLDTNLEDSIPF